MILESLYTISDFKMNGNDFSAQISFDATHDIFAGHFPDQPVLPGVCLIHIMKEMANMISDKEMLLTDGSNIKFLHMIDPGVNAEVQINGTYSLESNKHLKITAKIFIQDIVFFKFNGLFNPETMKP